MKIAVIGVYYASNLGDAIICDCVADWLRKRYPRAEVDLIDIEGKKEFAKQQSVSIFTLRYRRRKLQWDYWLTKHRIKDRVYYWNEIDVATRQEFYDYVGAQKYDAAIFAGGQLFMDWLSVDVCEFLKRFEKERIPVFFNACGTGFAVSDTIQNLLSCYLMNDMVKMISSRDDADAIKERYLFGKREVESTYDPALWVKEVYQIQKKESDFVGLGIMYSERDSIQKVTRFWIRLIKEMNTRHVKWKMFCNGSMDDYNFGCYVLKRLGLKKEEYLCACAQSPTELIQEIASFDSLISFRLHSHIVAASLDIPAIAVVWDEKLRFFYRHLGHEERCKTICDSAQDILCTLDKAKEEGYDKKQIQEQKKFARELLINAVEQEVCHE